MLNLRKHYEAKQPQLLAEQRARGQALIDASNAGIVIYPPKPSMEEVLMNLARAEYENLGRASVRAGIKGAEVRADILRVNNGDRNRCIAEVYRAYRAKHARHSATQACRAIASGFSNSRNRPLSAKQIGRIVRAEGE